VCENTMSEFKPRSYVEAKLDIPRSLADVVCNYIIENITSGLMLEEEEDSSTTGIIFYVSEDKKDWRYHLTDYLCHLIGNSMPIVPSIRERLIKNIEWEEQYKRSIKPVFIGEDIIVRPPWYKPKKDIKYDIIIEPKMAFGTGRHETTRSCLRIISERFKPAMRFLDVGCGSGVLSILADKMQASFIKAIDNDIIAVENCKENFKNNQVNASTEILLGSIEKSKGDTPYDFVCANIIRSTILFMLGDLVKLMADGGILVLSGLLNSDEKKVSARILKEGLTILSILPDNEWLTYTVSKN